MKLFNFAIGAITLFCLSSCEENIELIDEVSSETSFLQTKSVNMEIDTFNLHVIYKDVHYYSTCEIRNDSIFVLNPTLATLQDSLMKLPEFTSLRLDYGMEEYFDSREDFFNKYGIRNMEEVSLVNNAKDLLSINENSIANAVLYEDKDGNGKSYNMPIYLSDLYKIYEYPNFNNGPIGNDEVSSLFVNYSLDEPDGCALLEVWENKNYNNNDTETSKHFTYFMASKNHPHHAEYNLKTVQCLNAHDSWNDRISSCKFYLSYIDVLPDPY